MENLPVLPFVEYIGGLSNVMENLPVLIDETRAGVNAKLELYIRISRF